MSRRGDSPVSYLLTPRSSPLINRQRAVFQLQDRQIDCRRIDGADVALVPRAVRAGFGRELGEHLVAVLNPFFAPLAITNLGVIVVGVVPMAEAFVLDIVETGAAISQQLGDVLAVVIAGVEQA